ncbi:MULTISPECIES: alpha/beta fold hydrolase [unclassified Kribbella]|uniref:alpha/beta fold hydrolase n=1 Tax=unclassified Kribbella TaxID=2644121 RepID=UPI00307850F1
MTGEFTTRDGCVLRYRDTVTGAATVVLLHGWSQSQAMFDRLLPELPAEFRVISYDMRNHGLSGRTDRGARVSSLAADLRELLDHLGVEHAHFAGHSMGASVLWSYIDQHGTGRLDSLTIIDQPSVVAILPGMDPADAPTVGAILDFPGVEGLCNAVMGENQAAVRREFLASMVTKDIPADDLDWMYEQNLLLPMPWGSELLRDHALQDWRDVLPHIDVPTLVIGGEVSHVASTSQAWIASQIPGAQLKVFSKDEGGAHFPFFESPKDFAPVFTDFINAHA